MSHFFRKNPGLRTACSQKEWAFLFLRPTPCALQLDALWSMLFYGYGHVTRRTDTVLAKTQPESLKGEEGEWVTKCKKIDP